MALLASGLDGSRALLPSIGAMAQAYVEEILQQQSAGPYHLGGWCMGALIALEMANLLRGRGERVALVVLIDPDPAPARTGLFQRSDADRLVAPAAESALQSRSGRLLLRAWQSLLSLDPAALRQRAVEVLWRMVGFRRAWLPRAMGAGCIHALHKHATARHPFRIYDGAALLLTSRGQRERPLPHARGWEGWVTGPLQVEPMDCYNHEILVEPNVRTLAQHLCAALDAAGSSYRDA